jgi:hypothetical protein
MLILLSLPVSVLLVMLVLVSLAVLLLLKLVELAVVWETVALPCVVVPLSVPLLPPSLDTAMLMVSLEECIELMLPVVSVQLTKVCVMLLPVALVLSVLVPDTVRVVRVAELMLVAVLTPLVSVLLVALVLIRVAVLRVSVAVLVAVRD